MKKEKVDKWANRLAHTLDTICDPLLFAHELCHYTTARPTEGAR